MSPPHLATRAFAWGLGLVGAVLLMPLVADPLRSHPLAFVGLYGVAFSAYALACRALLRDGRAVPMAWVIAVAVAARLAALPATPGDDVARYLWEAQVVRDGGNPYLLAPDDPALDHLQPRAPWRDQVNHPSWTAIYPPLMQLWQAAVPPSALALKLSFLGAEALLAWLLVLLLRHHHLPATLVLVHLWNPLAIVSTAVEGHHDVVAAAALVGAVLLAERRSPWMPAVAALAVGLKGFALLALPALALSSRTPAPSSSASFSASFSASATARGRVPWWSWIALPLVLAGAALPFLVQGGGVLDSLLRFGLDLHTNDSLHDLLGRLVSPTATRAVLALAWCLYAGAVAWRGPRDAATAAAHLLGAGLLVAPTVHPWYLITLLPLLAITRWWGWLTLTGSVSLTWLAYLEMEATGAWVEWPLAKLAEYLPLFLWLLLCAARTRAARTP